MRIAHGVRVIVADNYASAGKEKLSPGLPMNSD